MTPLDELISLCKASISIGINEHRDYYQSVEDYFRELNSDEASEIDPASYQTMKDTNPVMSVQCYPHTPIGFILVYHYDVNEAIKIALKEVKSEGT